MRQEEALDGQEKEFRENIQQLHDRISTNSDKTTKHMNDMEKEYLTNYKKFVKNYLTELVFLKNGVGLLSVVQLL